MSGRRVLAMACLASVSGLASGSRAQVAPGDAAVHLSWTRSASALSCPDAGVVQADVVRRLRRSPFAEPASVLVEAAISRVGERWLAEIEMRDSAGVALGSRRVESDSAECASLASAAALAIALMIDPDALLQPAAPPPPAKPAPAAREPHEPPPAAKPAEAHRERRLALTGALVGVSRALPSPALGARLAGELRLVGRLDLALSFAFLPERRELRQGQDVSFGLAWGGLGPCYRLVDSSSVELSGCASVLLGALRTVVFDPARARTSQLVWSGAALGLRVGVSPIAPLQLQGGVDLMTPFFRRDYLVERAPNDYVTVFSDPSLSGAGFVGLGVQY